MSRSIFIVVAAALVVGVAAGCTAPPAPPWAPAGCYDSPVADAPDFRFSGTPNTKDNLTVALDVATLSLSTNGSCAGVPLGAPYAFTLVRAADEPAAQTLCAAAGLQQGAAQISSDYPSFPADAWVCNPPVTT